jgi:hypothetical protein
MSGNLVPKVLYGVVVSLLATTVAAAQETQPVPPAACVQGQTPATNCCPEAYRKVCVREPVTRKVPHTLYDCKREDFCAAPCPFARLGRPLGLDCQDCCGPVRSRAILLKRVVTSECPGWKCVVAHEYCASPSPVARTMPAQPSMTAAELLPSLPAPPPPLESRPLGQATWSAQTGAEPPPPSVLQGLWRNALPR